jgi:hypothetical protein
MKNKEKTVTQYRVSVVYGFKNKLEIVLLGEIISGEISKGMKINVMLTHGTPVGNWTVKEILEMDFINGHENKNYIGIVVNCNNESDFKLLQSLRVYEETIELHKQK